MMLCDVGAIYGHVIDSEKDISEDDRIYIPNPTTSRFGCILLAPPAILAAIRVSKTEIIVTPREVPTMSWRVARENGTAGRPDGCI